MSVGVDHVPRLRTRKGHDGVELPAVQQLAVAFWPGYFVTGRESGAVPDVEVAGGVFPIRIPAVLRLPAETIQGTIVQAMTVGITRGEIKPVGKPLSQGRLQAVVVGPGIVLYMVDILKVGELGGEGSDAGDEIRLIEVDVTNQVVAVSPDIAYIQREELVLKACWTPKFQVPT